GSTSMTTAPPTKALEKTQKTTPIQAYPSANSTAKQGIPDSTNLGLKFNSSANRDPVAKSTSSTTPIIAEPMSTVGNGIPQLIHIPLTIEDLVAISTDLVAISTATEVTSDTSTVQRHHEVSATTSDAPSFQQVHSPPISVSTPTTSDFINSPMFNEPFSNDTSTSTSITTSTSIYDQAFVMSEQFITSLTNSTLGQDIDNWMLANGAGPSSNIEQQAVISNIDTQSVNVSLEQQQIFQCLGLAGVSSSTTSPILSNDDLDTIMAELMEFPAEPAQPTAVARKRTRDEEEDEEPSSSKEKTEANPEKKLKRV
ncbi:hypothetical protein HDU76_005454, partial [Blyttiomyces sp. JEL0837]